MLPTYFLGTEDLEDFENCEFVQKMKEWLGIGIYLMESQNTKTFNSCKSMRATYLQVPTLSLSLSLSPYDCTNVEASEPHVELLALSKNLSSFYHTWAGGTNVSLSPVVNLIKYSMIVIYNCRGILTRKLPILQV